MAERTEKQRQRIADQCDLKDNILVAAQNALQEIELEHQRGEDWVHVDAYSATAIGCLTRLKMIIVITVDGHNRAQIRGAIK